MKVANKVIVVTGGGNGIGRALVLHLLSQGARVAAVDLNENALKETVALSDKPEKISMHVVNVSDRSAVEALPQQVIEAHGSVDGLINNAGIIQPFVRFADLPYEAIERVINVNLYGVIHMTKAFLPHLLKRPEAHIVNVSSMGGFFPFPSQTMYGASKAAVKILTEGIYSELIESNVRVTVVFPGAIATNISQNSGVTGLAAMDASSSKIPLTSAEKAAEAIIKGMEKNKFQVYVGNDAKLMNLLYKIAPQWATRFMQQQMKGILKI
jgi:short-subunit dehydrogenase